MVRAEKANETHRMKSFLCSGVNTMINSATTGQSRIVVKMGRWGKSIAPQTGFL
jgi:hypothetical protein